MHALQEFEALFESVDLMYHTGRVFFFILCNSLVLFNPSVTVRTSPKYDTLALE